MSRQSGSDDRNTPRQVQRTVLAEHDTNTADFGADVHVGRCPIGCYLMSGRTARTAISHSPSHEPVPFASVLPSASRSRRPSSAHGQIAFPVRRPPQPSYEAQANRATHVALPICFSGATNSSSGSRSARASGTFDYRSSRARTSTLSRSLTRTDQSGSDGRVRVKLSAPTYCSTTTYTFFLYLSRLRRAFV